MELVIHCHLEGEVLAISDTEINLQTLRLCLSLLQVSIPSFLKVFCSVRLCNERMSVKSLDVDLQYQMVSLLHKITA